ncbi:protein kinase [Trypanosoma rangeli]|uniref:Protein kinase n=1 Tax=Trypanosoma rangeli TaxID=5698 RepID=A0A3R7MJP3_TRYRA|nr:protein kinase [Trypanosoma rangeli]RNF03714.1 protein kinase [Trypanosoma rangeli]|eukprot:RNF03714.1 protein kinase [Trypanosoma rangeli]
MDRYRLDRYPCARTPMSTLYLCIDLQTDERLVVKVVSRSTPSAERRVRRMLHGTQVVARACRHPGLVDVRGIYEVDRKTYVVMEYVAGGSLLDHVMRRGPLREPAAVVVMRQLLEAVAHLHGSGVMHRDLKTENVLISAPTDHKGPPTSVRICDFGFAVSKMPNNECVGTPQYAAPEVAMIGLSQCRAGAGAGECSYDEKCDIWSLGVVAYAILSGMLPFDGGTPTEVFTKVLHQQIPFPLHAWQHVSEGAKAFVLFLMTPDPNKRPSALRCLHHPWLV